MPRPSGWILPKFSHAFRLGLALTVASPFSIGIASEARAFELFGFRLFGSDEADRDVIDPVGYTITLDTGDADRALKKSLERTSLLLADEEQPVSGDLGLVIKARDDRDRLIATLYENALYGGIVTVTIDGRDIDSLPPNPVFDRSRPVPVAISIDPGQTFTLGEVRLEGDAAGLNPEEFGLERGGNAGSLVILKSAEQIAESLREQGRPLTEVTRRDVVADHATKTVDLTIAVEAGPVAPLGAVTVKGARAVDSNFVAYYSRLRPGQTYSPEQLRKAGERLRTLGVFSSVTIDEAESLDPSGSLPIGITVSEGKHRYFGIGASYSSLDGGGIEGYWGHRNLFGQAESLRIEGSVRGLGELKNVSDVSSLDYTAGITFIKPGAFVPSGTLEASVKGSTLKTDYYDAATVTGKVSYAYELTDADSVNAGVSLAYDSIDDAFGKGKEYLTFGVPIGYVRDTRDNRLNATEGHYGTLTLTPSYEFFGQTIFSSLEGSISAYLGFGEEDRFVLAGRLNAGTLVGGGDLSAIPATRRFFAGGGGSVRGYSFQEITPRTAAGGGTGGRSYVTANLEARINVTETIGIVPFLDIGTVTDTSVPDFNDIKMGAGVGLRYMTPFGPLRLDVAVPLDPYAGGNRYAIYAGIGQSF
ncbi:outer membrane protein assembly factor [Rhizobium sp. AQ_MP]|uniref:autotransporter assembly complex protein TamA n=1 Tax=Rhizobium sp. AQ_MP TaxID=2761536 RepID=UPI00163AFC17|nr:autotransporter assembly complex family protein [Rhizobium sp. AQ_MP]MBC2772693.1 outer membrane protein assembly factor [Rhizobium sp. AQ_MP]